MKSEWQAFLVLLLSSITLPAAPDYEIHVGAYEDSWRTEIRFSDKKHPPVKMVWDGGDTFPYQPIFSKSPDGRWILLIQKTGSGDNSACLYTVDDAGLVRALHPKFDSLAWRFSDSVGAIPHSSLHHTGISDPMWTDRQTLTFTLQGSHVEKSGDGVSLALEYDLKKGVFSKR